MREILIHCEIWDSQANDNKDVVFTLKMDVACSPETLERSYQQRGRHIQEDSNLHFLSLKRPLYHEDRGSMFLRNAETCLST
jgi:hypothetical protein